MWSKTQETKTFDKCFTQKIISCEILLRKWKWWWQTSQLELPFISTYLNFKHFIPTQSDEKFYLFSFTLNFPRSLNFKLFFILRYVMFILQHISQSYFFLLSYLKEFSTKYLSSSPKTCQFLQSFESYHEWLDVIIKWYF